MTTSPATADVDKTKARLRQVCKKMDQSKAEGVAFKDERNSLVRVLKDAGVSRSELAELTGTSIDNVKQILRRE